MMQKGYYGIYLHQPSVFFVFASSVASIEQVYLRKEGENKESEEGGIVHALS
jgi:hypothetical protein